MSPEDLESLTEWLGEVSMDPLGYVLGAFAWGEGELKGYPDGPDEWQREVLNNIGQGVMSVQEAIALAAASGEEVECSPIREATVSGHGIGKSALVAWIILWAQDTCVDMKGRVTANTDNQLKTTTWAEVAKWHRLSVTADLFKMTATARFSIDPNHEKTWRMDMVPWSEKNPAAFAGLHNHGKRILLIFDEASEIADIIWEVAEGAMTDKNTEIIWACFGNPTKNTGRFRECFPGGRFAHRWNSRSIDSRTVKISNKTQLNDWVADYGEDHDFVRVRVRGMFPRVDATSFISGEDVSEAMTRDPVGQEYFPVILGVDVARYGPDNSVIAPRQGRDAKTREWVRAHGLNTVQLARLVFEVYMRYNAYAVCVDVGGVGGGVYDQLETMGVQAYAVDFGSGADEDDSGERYLNKRASMYGAMRKWIKVGGCLPSETGSEVSLSEQLTAPTYTYAQETKLQLESKKDIRKRLKISPDDADALACTFAEPWLDASFMLARPDGQEGPKSAYEETDPYKR